VAENDALYLGRVRQIGRGPFENRPSDSRIQARRAKRSASSTFCSMKITVMPRAVDLAGHDSDLLDHARSEPEEGLPSARTWRA
jgi:hypothetical protein